MLSQRTITYGALIFVFYGKAKNHALDYSKTFQLFIKINKLSQKIKNIIQY